MILAELRNYLQQRGQASLRDMALHFDADPDALRGMLERWIKKGAVSRRAVTASCGSSCTECDPASVELYVWAGAVANSVPLQRDLGCTSKQ